MNRENSFITKQNLAQLILNDDYFVSLILFLVLVSFGWFYGPAQSGVIFGIPNTQLT